MYNQTDYGLNGAIGFVLRLKPKIFLLCDLQTSFGLANIENRNKIIATELYKTYQIDGLGFGEQNDVKYFSFSNNNSNKRTTPTTIRNYGIQVGLRYTFGEPYEPYD
jgi:hypothetical protein